MIVRGSLDLNLMEIRMLLSLLAVLLNVKVAIEQFPVCWDPFAPHSVQGATCSAVNLSRTEIEFLLAQFNAKKANLSLTHGNLGVLSYCSWPRITGR